MPSFAVIAPDKFELDQLKVENGAADADVVRVDGRRLPEDAAGLLIYAPDGEGLTSERRL